MTDVAKLAGVSQSTVSLVINEKNTSTIPKRTQDKVREASQILGYRPNAIARAMHGKGSGVIGFITDELVTTNFAGNMYKGAQDTAWKKNKILMLVDLGKRRKMLDEAIDLMLSYKVEGFYYRNQIPSRVFCCRSGIWRYRLYLPIVYDPLERYTCFVPNEMQGAYDATRYLLQKGHRNIVFLSNELQIPATSIREEGFIKALMENGIEVNDYRLQRIKIKGPDIYRSATKLLQRKERPTAILCYNDRCAVSVYAAVTHLNLEVGRDVSIVGFDNQTVISEFVQPSLSTMQLPHYEMGQAAMKYLSAANNEAQTTKNVLDLVMVERNSVADLYASGRQL